MAKAEHVEWLKDGNVSWNHRRRVVKFKPDLSNLDFNEAILDWLIPDRDSGFFKNFNFSDADLQGANLSGLDFSRSKFSGANLSGADLTQAHFRNAKFNRANLSRVIALGAEFSSADFYGADFRDAQLEGANFAGASVEPLTIPAPQRVQVLETIEQVTPSDAYVSEYGSLAWTQLRRRAPEIREPTYHVVYATNRNIIPMSADISFGCDRSDTLHYGSCQVFVPKSHKVGSIGSPFWKRLYKGDDRLKIRKLVSLDGELHWQIVRENFSRSKISSPPTILIHGYNTDFESAILWAAQIGFDLGLERGVSLFSWPSKGTINGYASDEATVEASKYKLADYILEYIENVGDIGVNIIAHSMGCRCVTGALEIIGYKKPSQLKKINQIILAAADVDQDVMLNLAHHVVLNSGRTTSYICKSDFALSASGWLHSYARVGLLPPIFLFNQIDTIDVGRTEPLGWGHGYVASAKPILNDIFQLIKYSSAPENRFSVEPAIIGGSAHWRLRD
ncbi:conserved hypothetical protein with alpha/beta hydrolase and pentapeptide repeats domains [Aurantimonas manganoxydans SI85-9A1]|uniref:Alpha/beta hydrolase n=1 Tax=Aurantimonas manganoxydans (strain ATCC BAA-1229 / DSM 21871 / SI85-9A1) TaxID=287752 RepID=Q1YG85_AURMS|nr:alpha/beta hydrolase [Aurantimonas manganoxydans]EAS49340.1 conserved hypothetical protein with alpha/beta hydrolase and pentapeptide repeats domains [Aurantimonas manganoxydans SI85-9A1]